MSNLINKRAVRKVALDVANSMYSNVGLQDRVTDGDGKQWNYKRVNEMRTGNKYKQVSASFLDHIEAMVRVNVKEYIKKSKLTGSTVK